MAVRHDVRGAAVGADLPHHLAVRGGQAQLRPVGEPRQRHAEQPDRIHRVRSRQRGRGRLPQLGSVRRRLGQGDRAGHRREVGQADLHRDGPGTATVPVQPPKRPRQDVLERPRQLPPAQVLRVGAFRADALRLPLDHDRARVIAASKAVQVPAGRLPERPDQVVTAGRAKVGDRDDPETAQRRVRRRPDARQRRNRLGQEELVLHLGWHDGEPVRLLRVRGELGDQLRAPHPHGDDQPGPVVDEPARQVRTRGRVARERAGGQVDERLVEADRLDQWRELAQRVHDQCAVRRVRREPGRQDGRRRAQDPGLRHRHRRVASERARLVVRGGDHPTRAGAANQHGGARE